MPWYMWVVLWAVSAAIVLCGFMAIVRNDRADEGFLPELDLWRDGSTPFMLILDEEVTSARMVAACEAALRFWQEHVPGMFAPFGEIGAGATIPLMPSWKLATWSKETSCCAFGYTRIITREGRIWSASIYVDESKIDELSDLELWRAIAHEVGHVFGLAHDDDIRMSIMHPKALDERPTVTAADRALLSGVYSA